MTPRAAYKTTPHIRRHPTRSSLDWATAVARFEDDLWLSEHAERTVEGHTYELGRYAHWLATNGGLDWQLVTDLEIDVYARTRAHLSFSSRASLMTTMRVFYRWAEEQRLVPVSPAAHLVTPPRPKAVPKALSVEQVRTLLIYLDAHQGDGLRERRDRALLLTGLYTGMRAAELASTHWAQVDLSAQSITIPRSKMQRGRTIAIHPDLAPTLGAWGVYQGLQRQSTRPVFSLGVNRISADRVGKVARHYAKVLDLPLTAHVLRHTFATWALRKSGNLYSVSKALGHGQIQQTEVYLRSDPSDSEEAVGALPDMRDW